MLAKSSLSYADEKNGILVIISIFEETSYKFLLFNQPERFWILDWGGKFGEQGMKIGVQPKTDFQSSLR
jgi:hypothetical protein